MTLAQEPRRTVTVRAPAKLNLHLSVASPRADGYHPLSTVYHAVSLYDDVSVSTEGTGRVTVTPAAGLDVSGVPLDGTNIALRAVIALAAHHGIELTEDQLSVDIDIHKGIPVAGGMAGGSADAAAALVALDRLWDLQTPDDELLTVAGELGSDVPFALLGGTAVGTGRGELVEPVADVGSRWWTVLCSDHGLSTPEVYAAYDRLVPVAGLTPPDALLDALAQGGDIHDLLHNDLELAAMSLRKDLAEVRQRAVATGATSVHLSGSGPTWLVLEDGHHEALHRREKLLSVSDTPVLIATGPVAGAHVVEY